MKNARNRQADPSRASLREIPEVDFNTAKVRRNPFADRIAAEGIVHAGRGRPKKGQETGPTFPRSIRFSEPVWTRLKRHARAKGLTLHAALREAVLEWVNR
jgi:hypothetical protein